MPYIQDMLKLMELYKLKSVERVIPVDTRQESAAEHTWSSLILADYIFDKMPKGMDKLRVFELLIYHDVVEIDAGDVSIDDEEGRKGKHEREISAVSSLSLRIPGFSAARLKALFSEFEGCTTPEARFARAIDKLDALIHALKYMTRWQGWDERKLRKLNSRYFKGMPVFESLFEEIVGYARAKGYLDWKQ